MFSDDSRSSVEGKNDGKDLKKARITILNGSTNDATGDAKDAAPARSVAADPTTTPNKLKFSDLVRWVPSLSPNKWNKKSKNNGDAADVRIIQKERREDDKYSKRKSRSSISGNASNLKIVEGEEKAKRRIIKIMRRIDRKTLGEIGSKKMNFAFLACSVKYADRDDIEILLRAPHVRDALTAYVGASGSPEIIDQLYVAMDYWRFRINWGDDDMSKAALADFNECLGEIWNVYGSLEREVNLEADVWQTILKLDSNSADNELLPENRSEALRKFLDRVKSDKTNRINYLKQLDAFFSGHRRSMVEFFAGVGGQFQQFAYDVYHGNDPTLI